MKKNLPTLFKNYEINQVFNKSMDLMEPHAHNHYEIFLFLTGDIYYIVDDLKYFIENGDILLINCNSIHHPIIDKKTKINRIALSIEKSYLDKLSSTKTNLSSSFENNLNPIKIIKTTHNEYLKILSLFEHLIVTEKQNSYGCDLLTEATLIQLLVLINSTFYNQILNLDNIVTDNNSLTKQIENYISKNFMKNITLDLLEENFYLSKYHLSRTFKASTGISIYNYIQIKRITHAKSLIHFGLNFNEIYNSCGFEDYSNFYRTFVKIVGMSPKKYKENIKKNAL